MKALDLRGRRQSVGLRLEPVAIEIGVHNNTLTDVERGRIGIDRESYDLIVGTIERLAATTPQRGAAPTTAAAV